MVSSLFFDSMGTSNVLNSFSGTALTGAAGSNFSIFGDRFGFGAIAPFTAEELARMTPEERSEAIIKYRKTQADVAHAEKLANRQSNNATITEENTINSQIQYIKTLINNSDDCKVYKALRSLVNTIIQSESYKKRVNGEETSLSQLEAKAMVVTLYSKYTNGGNLDAEIQEHLDYLDWWTDCDAENIIDWLHNDKAGGTDNPLK